MNVRELREAVRLRNGITETSPDALAEHDTINACVVDALRDICEVQRWPWLLTSASVTFTGNSGPLPSDCTQVHRLAIGSTGATRLHPATHVGLDEFLSQSRAYVWTTVGSAIKLYPTPTSTPVATLYYYRDEPAFTVDTDSPLLPVAHQQTLVARASYHLNVRRQNSERMNVDVNEWEAGLRHMKLAVLREQGPRKVRSSFRTTQQGTW